MVGVRALQVGDVVTVVANTYERAGSWSEQMTIRISETDDRALRITRIFEERVIVRGPVLRDGREASFYVWRHHLTSVNGVDRVTGEVSRRLGMKPEDTEEMTYIGLDHPGIQWAWSDLAEYANGKSWCDQYDRLARDFGIPGRPREWSVSVEIDGIRMLATISAQSLIEAEGILRQRVAALSG